MKWLVAFVLIPILLIATGLRVDFDAVLQTFRAKPQTSEIQTLRLKNGNTLVGEVTAETPDAITINLDGASMVFKRSEIASNQKTDISRWSQEEMVAHGLKRKGKTWIYFDEKKNIFTHFKMWDPVGDITKDSDRVTEKLKKRWGPSASERLDHVIAEQSRLAKAQRQAEAESNGR